ncbi:deoxyguanosinetriphosphate triphosphohydrolase family protein [Desulfosudis oleivorans]|uniref:Metal-dependent phosphohydrolase HD sub domain n=1 Tax=Desulfosudis oleivorans (strain DSM 6200 / JCM 39069 / Hxd3) TaxID=96561 RepID=A8ZXH3_DESOH|nr:HD domain-containing protein [Desulfosudis oleivorans]ABW66931.1 metal-dependent phosphohydrolase HD sub domain [Desulfosudis oleivorans Hxd3]
MSPTWNTIKSVLERREQQTLSSRAESSAAGIRRRSEDQLDRDYRLAFAVDVDRILHSLAYTRYIDKTQVFYLIENDHITHRVLHVQLVSKVARTIGRALGLNEDLIEAIALGHDIGHAPFGHEGETYLSKLCEQAGIGPFLHNVQSVHFLESVERKGRGCNLCLQTLDGILCHDGEIHTTSLKADRKKNFQTFEEEIAAKRRDPSLQLTPMTMEGCVVRFADTISYIGRDIEDAIRLGLVRREDLPAQSTTVLGDTNGKIVYSLVTDVVTQSMDKDHVAFSEAVSAALRALKRFNYEHIYMNQRIKSASNRIESLFALLFERYHGDLEADNRSSVIFTHFLKDMSPDYLERHTPPEVVRDFISGMTDNYFLRQCPPDMQPVLDVAGT